MDGSIAPAFRTVSPVVVSQDFRADEMRFSSALLISLIVCVCFLLPAKASATTFDDIGFTQLQLELGVSTPGGASVTVSHVEAFLSGNYLPNTGGSEFIGKTFNIMSGASGVSSHATTVGRNFYVIGLSV